MTVGGIDPAVSLAENYRVWGREARGRSPAYESLAMSVADDQAILSFLDTFPVPKRAAYQKFKNPASRFAIVGVFVAQTAQGVRVAVTGAGNRGVFRVKAMETALARDWSAKAIESVNVPASELQSDIHASAEYRAHLVNVLARRAIAAS